MPQYKPVGGEGIDSEPANSQNLTGVNSNIYIYIYIFGIYIFK